MTGHSVTAPADPMQFLMDNVFRPHFPGLPASPNSPRDPEAPTPATVGQDDPKERFFETLFIPAYVSLMRARRGLPDAPFPELPVDLQQQYRVDARQALALHEPRARAYAIVAMSLVLDDTLATLSTRSRAEVLHLLGDAEARQRFAERQAEACAAAYLHALTAPEARA